jgi:hypothetical protein
MSVKLTKPGPTYWTRPTGWQLVGGSAVPISQDALNPGLSPERGVKHQRGPIPVWRPPSKALYWTRKWSGSRSWLGLKRKHLFSFRFHIPNGKLSRKLSRNQKFSRKRTFSWDVGSVYLFRLFKWCVCYSKELSLFYLLSFFSVSLSSYLPIRSSFTIVLFVVNL